jgi:hypothetical protein
VVLVVDLDVGGVLGSHGDARHMRTLRVERESIGAGM